MTMSSCATAFGEPANGVNPKLRITFACEADVPTILEFIRGLADYQRMPSAVMATEASLRQTLFGPHPSGEVLLAFHESECVGCAIYFATYSSMLAQSGIYLDDLYVKPQWRGQGIGRALLRHLAAIAVDRNCGRIEWMVLNWNAPAIRLYEGLGAVLMSEWTKCRLTEATIREMAAVPSLSESTS